MNKYIVIDLSKLDGDKLASMLNEAYQNGYDDAKREISCIGYETSIYTTNNLNGTTASPVSYNYSTITNSVELSDNTNN